MSTHLEYKGYLGSVEVDVERRVIVGRLLFIRDAIGYGAIDVAGIEAAFHEAVDEYLALCADRGEEPDTPLKGTFNVRIGPELHREVALAARARGLGLNEFVKAALIAEIRNPSSKVVHHEHKHDHQISVHIQAGDAPIHAYTSGAVIDLELPHGTTHH